MSAGASCPSDTERGSGDGSRYRLRGPFTPLDTLLVSGGDPRLALDPQTGLNGYGLACTAHRRGLKCKIRFYRRSA